MAHYVIGLDFGTLSGRAALVHVEDGEIIGTTSAEYPHKVLTQTLPDGRTKLGVDWALQVPGDYEQVMIQTIRGVLEKTQINADDIIGLALDFTASTVLPVDAFGRPLCEQKEYGNRPHAYVKLWKHHSAQNEAEMITALAAEHAPKLLQGYGGKISSEWMIPKALQIYKEDNALFNHTAHFIEAGDWLTWQLTGQKQKSSCFAGFKGCWDKQLGAMDQSILEKASPGFGEAFYQRQIHEISTVGTKAGTLTDQWAQTLGLKPGIAVGTPLIDAHAGLPGTGISESGKMLLILGTSTCHIVLSEVKKEVAGICGVVEDGILPGLYAYEAGQACVGDQFDWFVKNALPQAYLQESVDKGMDPHQLLAEKASHLGVGESGLIALDWWNGNRTPLVNYDLSGVIVGLKLSSKPEEIYRALIEATAFGTRMIIETFEEAGIPINELYACGGIVDKNPLLMQIYADVCNREIYMAASTETPALGSAIAAAAAAGLEKGGYKHIGDAISNMARVRDESYSPNLENKDAYETLYQLYKKVFHYFGDQHIEIMKELHRMKTETNLNRCHSNR